MFVNDNIEMKGSASTSYGLYSTLVSPANHLGAHNEMKGSASTPSNRTK